MMQSWKMEGAEAAEQAVLEKLRDLGVRTPQDASVQPAVPVRVAEVA